MEETIAHRGPDDRGIWCDDPGIGLAHRRLSIIDLSPLGHQPMHSGDGRWVLAYNGEVYNHAELRRQLSEEAPRNWRGHSDTETLVECVSAWGLRRTLERSVGMFALALWDRRERKLHLARDRFGEKPLYYGWVGGDFVFGSELKAIRRHPRFDNQVSRHALRAYTARAYVPAPLSIFENIYKLEPGCILTADDSAWRPGAPPSVGGTSGGVRIERYWSYREVVQQGLADPIGDPEQAVEELESAVAQAIAGQAVADVPVGAFLSGGIDSSTVVALYQAHSPGRVKTFSIGFEEAGFDEAVYAKAVARHFGTEHHESYVSSQDAIDVIPSLPAMYDEPFGDSSQIPTHLVSRMARKHVTVALSGDGGDELFGGYNRYIATDRLWSRLKQVPRPMRAAAGGGMALVPPQVWNAAATLLPSGRRPAFFGTRVQKAFRTVRDARTFDDLVGTFLDDWAGNQSPVIMPDGAPRAPGFDMNLGDGAPDVTRMMYSDAVSYLPDDILCKVDRAGMAVSLETRIPFLDHRVAAVAARIPAAMNVRGGTGKLILRELLYKHAPRALFNRPKAGFAIPIGEWLKGPLRDWAKELLRPERLRAEGLLPPRSGRATLALPPCRDQGFDAGLMGRADVPGVVRGRCGAWRGGGSRAGRQCGLGLVLPPHVHPA
jgi:asparagine synthase (glutamine-hydrolysing)